ncbi:hypothetical protein CDD82_529 [Ophiocordyceps australis]|uniref:Uncharacterized protein n=1 Tax=Ophiocordyceps australis TaxID=1399860 RepID=A0A2C5YG34_9HYPO|nr:hypothetical protein CDD82_529 [Ophiocordyceps australis]
MKGLVILSTLAACLPATLAAPATPKELKCRVKLHVHGLCVDPEASTRADRELERQCFCQSVAGAVTQEKVDWFTVAQACALEESPKWQKYFADFGRDYCGSGNNLNENWLQWDRRLPKPW